MISRIYFGVDISKLWFDVCMLVGSKESYSRYDNTPDGFERFLKAVPEDAKKIYVCMEYTGGFETALALACKEARFVVSLVDGAKIAYFRRSFGSSVSTTDKSSSRLLALFCKQRKPAEWFPVPDEYRTLVKQKRLRRGKRTCHRSKAHPLRTAYLAGRRG
jgi:transposase